MNTQEKRRLERNRPQARGVTHADQVKKIAQEVQEEIHNLVKKAELDLFPSEPVTEMKRPSTKGLLYGPSYSPLTDTSPLSGMHIGLSLSTKLNYILSDVGYHHSHGDSN